MPAFPATPRREAEHSLSVLVPGIAVAAAAAGVALVAFVRHDPGPLRLANGDAIVAVDAPRGGDASDDVGRFERRAVGRRALRADRVVGVELHRGAGAGHRQLRHPPGRTAPLADRVRAGDRGGRRHPLQLRAGRGSAARGRRARRGAGARRAGAEPRAPAGRRGIAGRAGRDRAGAAADTTDAGNAGSAGNAAATATEAPEPAQPEHPGAAGSRMARAGASSPATGGTARRSRRWARRASAARRSAWESRTCSRSPTWRACSGHPAEAVAPLQRIVDGFAADPQAPLAAFALGRLQLDDLNQPHAAAAASAARWSWARRELARRRPHPARRGASPHSRRRTLALRSPEPLATGLPTPRPRWERRAGGEGPLLTPDASPSDYTLAASVRCSARSAWEMTPPRSARRRDLRDHRCR